MGRGRKSKVKKMKQRKSQAKLKARIKTAKSGKKA